MTTISLTSEKGSSDISSSDMVVDSSTPRKTTSMIRHN
jgi:hypothetical protein